MAIIRSKIARQLLAEGGVPRKRFFQGSYGDETEGFDFGQEAPASSSPSFEGVDSGGFDPGVAAGGEFGGGSPEETFGGGDDNFIIETLKNLGTSVGDKVRARIVTISINEISPREAKIGLTMRQPGLGKHEWIAEDQNKAAAGGE